MMDFVTVEEACGILRLGERTDDDLCRGGATRVGGRRRLEKVAFAEWVKGGGGSASAATPQWKEHT